MNTVALAVGGARHAMREHLVLFINGRRHEVRGADAFLTLAEFVRSRLRFTGTKVVCSEGDCGSCSVLIGRMKDGKLEYHSVDSCIQFMFQLDGTHVVTVEGLKSGDELSAVQRAMVTHHGSQCGYCTPGFVVAITGLIENSSELNEDAWRCGLTGNLCRCTGYTSILTAGMAAARETSPSLIEMYPPAAMIGEFERLQQEPFEIQSDSQIVSGPTDIAAAIQFMARHPDAKIVAGATDVGVQVNKRIIAPRALLDLNRISTLSTAKLEGNELHCGARARWFELETLCREHVPEFAKIISIFGSPQIRHVGTIGGNIVNASPIADSLPFLFIMEAELEIAGLLGSRLININDFYQGYRQTDLKPAELLVGVRIPLPTYKQQLALYKVSRRRDLDIATFTAGILLKQNGGQIQTARIALGAVGPTVLRARKTEAYLRGKPFTEAVMRGAGEMVMNEITPISDVRGSADFRWQLTRNVFLKFFHERTRAAA